MIVFTMLMIMMKMSVRYKCSVLKIDIDSQCNGILSSICTRRVM